MELAKVLKLTDAVEDVRYESAVDCLERVLGYVKDGFPNSPEFKATKALVLLLDEHDGKYHLKRLCSAAKCSELVALLAVAQQQELRFLVPDSTGE
jgi:hypothetical protein